MHLILRTTVSLAALLLAGCGGGGEEPTPQPVAQPAPAPAPAPAAARTASGAALEYPAALAKFTDAISEDARQLAFNTKGVSLNASRAKGTWSALSRSLEQMQPQIEALLRVAETTDCAFAPVTLEANARKLPPDLVELFRGVRNGGAMLAADAARTYVAGDTAGAARRAAAIASMLRHVAGSGLPKASDFADDLFNRLEQIVPPMAAGVNGAKMADADRATLLAALNAPNAADPCGNAGILMGAAAAEKQSAQLAALKAALGGSPK